MRQFPRDVTKEIAVYHLPTTAPQQYPSSPDETISAGFLPMDARSHALEGGEYTDPFELYTEPEADIRVADKLVIEETTYYVMKVFEGTFGGIPHKRASLSKDT